MNTNDHVVDQSTGHAVQGTLSTLFGGALHDNSAFINADSHAIIEGALHLVQVLARARSEFVIDTGHLEHGVHQHAAPVPPHGAGTARIDEVALEESLQRIDRRWIYLVIWLVVMTVIATLCALLRWIGLAVVASQFLLVLLAWNWFFIAFHGVFFDAGTWTFNWSDSLIRLFPDKFWFDAGVLLVVLGLTAFSSTPVILSLIQQRCPAFPATANGIYMMISFMLGSLTVLLAGRLSASVGVVSALKICACCSLLGLPFLFLLNRGK